MLPQPFIDRMKKMLGSEYEEFEACFDREKYQALRFNTLKGEKQHFLDTNEFHLSQVEWSENGFYYEKEDTPGKHPYHDAGVYYIQEPSAQMPGSLLNALPGERILDFCSAPGGKATQIASSMKGEGLLVCNEYVPNRAKILSENIERMGIKNALVINETPSHLAQLFPSFFHRIMVDAPCSGEGMFRKNEEAKNEWSLENVQICADRQDEILDAAATMLLPGGRIVYSTCTFAPDENEGSVLRFIERHPDFHLVESHRLWPHKVKGEGHFVAKIQKLENEDCNVKYIKIKNNDKEVKDYREFEKKFLNISMDSRFDIRGENLYLLPEEHPDTKKLKVLRYGLHLGMLKKNRFEPSHALSHYLKMEDVKNVENFSIEDNKVLDYLRGNTIETGKSRGWVLVCVEGIGLGWGKESNGILKNHYPKGLRINY